MMKEVLIIVFILMAGNSVFTQDNKPIKLNEPDLSRGLTYMQTLSVRASVKEFDTTTLSLQDLSDLLWAANGINRPDEKKRTAPSAMNAQDIDVYVFFKYGIYLYDAMNSQLNFIAAGDYRYMIAGRQEKVAKAPVICLLVSDISRFRAGSDSLRHEWANIDAGIVSQNISAFCASVGLATRPRASMDKEKLKETLKLSDTQFIILNNPVSYKKE